MSQANELFQSGQLQAALDACAAEVKSDPLAQQPRGLLALLLCYAGDYERTESHFNVLADQADDDKWIQLLRCLVRAAVGRQDFFQRGQFPEFASPPDDYLAKCLEANICVRDGDLAEAKRLLDLSEQQRPKVSGSCDGVRFYDLRDVDDLLSGVVEAFTSTGKYYWVPMARIRHLRFEAPSSPWEFLWRATRIDTSDGISGVVYVPQVYFAAAGQEDDELRLGRAADWAGGDDQPLRGLGHRMWWVHDEGRPLSEITEIRIDHDAESPSENGPDSSVSQPE